VADLPKNGNATPALARSIRAAAAAGQSTLLLPEGEFHFWPEGSTRKFLYLSNNDDGENDIIALLEGVKDLHIQGQNTRLIFHGKVTPFALLNCTNIRISDVVIDWDVPFHCEATVASVSQDGRQVELEFHKGFSFRVDDGEFYFVGEGFEQKGIKNILEFVPDRRETRLNVLDNYMYARSGTPSQEYRATLVGERRVRLDMPKALRAVPVAGNVVIVMPIGRIAPAIFVEDSHRVALRGVIINHSGSMGVIGQTSSEIDIINSAVVPSHGRLVSSCVDAVHFVNCSGTINIENSSFSHHIDDALNVHGIYVRIKSRLDQNRLAVEFVDFQQRGVRCIRAGDLASLEDRDNAAPYFSGVVDDVTYSNERDAVVTFVSELPESIQEGDVINVLTRQANVLFRNNRVEKNRARGVLVKTLGQMVIEGNYFHTPGSAIFLPGGVTHWYESGPTSFVLIRNNVFDHSKYGVWGDSVITFTCRDAGKSDSLPPYHGVVVIVDNEFRSHVDGLVSAYRVEQLVVKRNRILLQPYAGSGPDARASIKIQNVGQHVLSENLVTGGELEVVNTTSQTPQGTPEHSK
jgi:hypothetical protein